MFARYLRPIASAALLCLLSALVAPAGAQITVGGDAGEVSPADPTTWTSDTYGEVGIDSGMIGTITVAGGNSLLSYYGYLGYGPGTTGTASITDVGSAWINSSKMFVGYSGTGSLSVANGGQVSSPYGYLGYSVGSSGTATVTGSGSSWTSNSSLTVGQSGTGTLTVADGGAVSSAVVCLGLNSTGAATVTGTGSSLLTSGTLYVGYSGTGTLNVTNGGSASSASGEFGHKNGAGTASITGVGSTWTISGALHVGFTGPGFGTGTGTLIVANGGTVTTGTLYASAIDLQGDGTINAKSLYGDVDLVFDAAHGVGQAAFGTGGRLNLNLDSTSTLVLGYRGTGSLRVAEGVKINSATSYLGYNTLCSATATVTGTGSTWTNSGDLYVGSMSKATGTLTVANGGKVSDTSGYLGYVASVSGTGSSWTNSDSLYLGAGTLSVADGGKVSDTFGYLGSSSYSAATATVTGVGSTWTTSKTLCVGSYGAGTLTISNGGQVTGKSVSINNLSTVNLHVTGDDMLVTGDAATTGSIANSGQINLYADAFLGAKTYSPITEFSGNAIAWTGTGTCNAFGGTWDGATFTVAAAATSDSAASNALVTGERLLITDSDTGKRVGASFGTVADGINFSAAVMGDSDLAGLAATLPANQTVLGAWNFTTNFTGGQALLSFDVGAGQSYDMSVWHYNGTSWAPVVAPDLTYGADGIADFAVTSLGGGYALTAAAHGGDANCDNAVNVVDLGVLAKYYDTAAGADWSMADFSGDGAVNVVDLGILAKNYDWVGVSGGAVPEPCSLALLALGGLRLIRRRK